MAREHAEPLLTLETERRRDDTLRRVVEIAVVVNHDGIFSAHLEHGAFDPELAVALLDASS
jgi:hypothetical protein